ncbi:gliding motility-associated ABC transporter ATP-binding subunit GldA [Penaeicola halotolerans]|uniref:gliding motility-associated ABC transporter ATP-binding subunit GldA n=1 Tax=Penaeicola halotolerans TaxID=2793196 RepID=UPI001CF8EC83|nr:gliding motility-associated ABC transporter ATP-binding subunit GldA [Penaeicola halotolerans]
MSIKVVGVSKFFGLQKALDEISFEAKEGQILGFLGPNGAGKSTTMKIATGYLSADTGEVTICGIDVAKDPIAAKRMIGYLPEHNPLYLDMYVKEYLSFTAALFDVPRSQRKDSVHEMIEKCGLTLEQHKKIGQLSKGYRQRVGLAKALIHQPKVLILDEPTTGLDPNQLVEIRSLIKSLSKDKTVIFSTHIMQEVQALCDQVVIINKGKIVANDRLDNLTQSTSEEDLLYIELSTEVSVEILMSIKGVISVEQVKSREYLLKCEKSAQVKSKIVGELSQRGLSVEGLRQQSDSLETIFHQLTR